MNLPSQSSPSVRIDDAPISVIYSRKRHRPIRLLVIPIHRGLRSSLEPRVSVRLDRVDCNRSITARCGSDLGSARYAAEISLDVGVLCSGRQARNLQVKRFHSAAPEEMIPRNGNETRLARFRASHFPARMHTHPDAVHV